LSNVFSLQTPEPRILPHSIEAEQALLGILLTWPEVYERVADKLRPEHFYDGANQQVFETIAGIESSGRRAGMIPVATALPERKAYLANLAGSTVAGRSNAIDYAETLVDFWLRREVMRIAQDAGVSAAEASVDRRGTQATGGLMPGELIIAAGRPGMGKSTFAMTVALNAARASTTVAFFSGEMSSDQLTQWGLAEATGISADRQRRGALSVTELDDLARASGDLRPLPLLFDDTPGLSVAQVRMRARRLKRKKGLGLIIIDHLGLLAASKEASKQGETAAITEITKHLKRLAKELNVPILALSQLNRAVEARDDKRPGMSDLRQSGSIEQDADVIIMCYRAEYYLSKTKPEQRPGDSPEKHATKLSDWHEGMDRCRGIAELIGVKHRSGPEFRIECAFQPESSRMANLMRGEFR
jgi:replicative DNA helicase